MTARVGGGAPIRAHELLDFDPKVQDGAWAPEPDTAKSWGEQIILLEDNRLLIAILVIAGLMLSLLAVSAPAARRNCQYNMDRLYPPVEV